MIPAAPLFAFKSGDHICVFYRNEQYLLDLLTRYVVDGLENNEKCFLAQKADRIAELTGRLADSGIDVEKVVGNGSLEIHSEEEVYLASGSFVAHAMMPFLTMAIADAKARGYSRLRTAGEMSWAAMGRCDLHQLMAYEAMVREAFPSRPVIGMCQYDMRRFSPAILGEVMDCHSAGLSELGARHTVLSLRHDGYFADVVADRFNPQSRFYYVAQAHNQSNVVGWGAESTFAAAVEMAETLLAQVSRGAPERA